MIVVFSVWASGGRGSIMPKRPPGNHFLQGSSIVNPAG